MSKTKTVKKKAKMQVRDAIEKIVSCGLSVYEHENNSEHDNEVRHLTILGGVRRVSFYPSTLTVFASKEKDFPQVKTSGIDAAIRVAKDGK
ncbi:hypothetical protein [Salmonella enterica]|uniref:Tail fibers protein n=1 Tax=Salmonella phage vB_Se_STGO-35-1 TaxID=2749381 RepID=A0A889IND0_9CAUD|nr:hypothetical protein [Salmonella enterica]YP_010054090.1 tail fibers protein [Salmonella phage vB_Se_STGO-35-1]QRD99805.1 tail fibers protein [Salmonella phage vB_Se_STGO-35-1]